MYSDFKFAVRSLVKTPGFTLVALFTLALGIGGTVAIFSMVNAVLLKPLPFAQPERLVRIYTEFPSYPNGGIRRFVASEAEYFDLLRETRSWQSLGAWSTGGVNITTSEAPIRVTASFVTGGLLASLGVAPAFGRGITPKDDEPGAPRVAIISHGLWQRAYGGDRAIVGRDILLDGRNQTVVGVMPEDFRFPVGDAQTSDIWVPSQIDPAHAVNDSHSVALLGHLKPGVTLQQAQAELDALVLESGRTGSGHHFDPKDHTLLSSGLHDEVVRSVRPALQMLFGAVCFLLLIACANVASLLLARAEARQREIAIRGALGAGLRRLARQFASEGILLSLLGALFGLLFAQSGLQLVKLTGTTSMSQVADARIDGNVILFAVAMSLLTGLVFGLAPLVHVLKRNLHGAMKSAAASTTEGGGTQRFRQALIVGQLALALVLLTGTGLMLRAFWKLQQVDAGFDPRGVVTMAVALPESLYEGEAARSFWTKLQGRLSALPGVQSAALTKDLPPASEGFGFGTQIEGFVPVAGGPIALVPGHDVSTPVVDYYRIITPSYFETLKIRLVEGRRFDERDDAQSARVAIVNQTLVRAIWGSASALGHRLRPAGNPSWYTIIGVVADTPNAGLAEPAGTEIYFSYAQEWALSARLRVPYIAVRSSAPTASVVSAVGRELAGIDPTLPLAKVRTMEEVMSEAQSRPRFLTLVLSLFASVALVLAAVGIYGVISYAVAQRTREFGIRMALGAQPRSVQNLVIRQGLTLVVCGLLVGLACSLALTRFLSGFLFGIAPKDPVAFVGVSLLLGATAMLASYIPARRATRVDPLVALRAE